MIPYHTAASTSIDNWTNQSGFDEHITAIKQSISDIINPGWGSPMGNSDFVDLAVCLAGIFILFICITITTSIWLKPNLAWRLVASILTAVSLVIAVTILSYGARFTIVMVGLVISIIMGILIGVRRSKRQKYASNPTRN